MFKKLFAFCIFNISLYAHTINIAIATNVSYAIHDLKNAFLKKYPQSKIQITISSSGSLTAQILNGAAYDIFMSANMIYPKTLYDKKINVSKPVVYTKGSLSFFSIKKQDFSLGISLLLQKHIKTIAIGNPKISPYGFASIQAIKNANIYINTSSKFVYANSIAQTLSYGINATDISIVATSSLYSKNMKKYEKNINHKQLDKNLYSSINQGIVRLNDKKMTKKFYEFILSPQAQNIFEKYGYIKP